jgi:hypothetical protein
VAINKDTFRVIRNTREEWTQWRRSETPITDAVHTVFEVLLVLGWAFRFLSHAMFHAVYLEDEEGNTPEYCDDDFRFTALVWPVLEPVNWRHEALMRVCTAILGVSIFALGVNPTVKLSSDLAMTQLKIYMAWSQGGYMILDPLLGVCQRIIQREQPNI